MTETPHNGDAFTRPAAEVLTFADILAKAKPARRTCYLTLNGSLLDRHDQLVAQLDEQARIERLTVRNSQDEPERGLGDADPLEAAREELADVLEQMRASKTAFTFQMLPRTEWDVFRKPYEKPDGSTDFEAMSIPLIAVSSVTPEMTEENVTALFEVLNVAQRRHLWETAWAVNTGEVDIPFSPAGSAAEKARASGRK